MRVIFKERASFESRESLKFFSRVKNKKKRMSDFLLNNEYCYSCRVSSVRIHPNDYTLRVCTSSTCGKVQDFLMDPCSFPSCKNTVRVPTYSLKGMTPETAITKGKVHFCSTLHREAPVYIPDIRIYMDSETEPLANHSTICSLPMCTTSSDLIERALLDYPNLNPKDFVLAVDNRRRVGSQLLGVLKPHELIHTYLNGYSDLFLIVFALSEYNVSSQLPPMMDYSAKFMDLDEENLFPPIEFSVGPVAVMEDGEEGDDDSKIPFVLDDTAPITRIHEWLAGHGISKKQGMLEKGVRGPKLPKESIAVLVVITEAEMDRLFMDGFHSSAVCPFLLRKEFVIILLACSNDKNHQAAIYDNLNRAYDNDMESFYKWTIDYQQKEFGFGQFAISKPGFASSKHIVDPATAMEVQVPIEFQKEVRRQEILKLTCNSLYSFYNSTPMEVDFSNPATYLDEEDPMLPDPSEDTEPKIVIQRPDFLLKQTYCALQSNEASSLLLNKEDDDCVVIDTAPSKKKRDKEEEFVPIKEKKARKRMSTTSEAKKYLESLSFTKPHASNIIAQCLKPMAVGDTGLSIFSFEHCNKNKDLFNFVPITVVDVARIPKQLPHGIHLTPIAYKKLHLLCYNCGRSRENFVRVQEELKRLQKVVLDPVELLKQWLALNPN